jgi:hypothetical protein
LCLFFFLHAALLLQQSAELAWLMIWQGLFLPSVVSLMVPLALMSLTRFLKKGLLLIHEIKQYAWSLVE